MRAFKVTPKALRILAKKLTHLACNSRAQKERKEPIMRSCHVATYASRSPHSGILAANPADSIPAF